MPLGVTSFEGSLFIHITAAIVGLGAPFVDAFTHPVAMSLNRDSCRSSIASSSRSTCSWRCRRWSSCRLRASTR
jgi:hypothetical protein